MFAGRLDRRIKLQSSVRALDGVGQQVENWSDYITCWASVKPISDGERFGGGEIKAYATHRFQIRWHTMISGLDATWRVQYDGREYEISGVKELGRREGFEITATARAD